MKSVKRVHFALLNASLLLASNLLVHAQSSQQSSDQHKPDSSSTNQPAKKNADGATTPAKNNPKDSLTSAPVSASSAATTATPKKSPSKTGGVVWVNTESGVYHKRGSRWYGKTRQGKYMLEADAIKAGYKASGRN